MHYFNEEYFPKKEQLTCPPEDSHGFEGTLYRFTQSFPTPTVKDWEAADSNSNKRQRWGDNNDYKSLCRGAGVSCFSTEEDAKKAFEIMKGRSKGLAKKFNGIFPVSVSDTDGMLADTSSARKAYKHFTFWISNKSKIASREYTCIDDKEEIKNE